jgi:hypothetical protein
LRTGALADFSGLSPGVHQITASVVDSLGASGSDTITLTVLDEPPSKPSLSPGMLLLLAGTLTLLGFGVAMRGGACPRA